MSWTRTLLALTFGALAIVAIRAADEPLPNTGMADPAALVSTFDRFAADRTDPNVLILTLSNLRGLSSEERNTGGSVRIDLATGDIASTLQLMPATDTFDLWLVDNQPVGGDTTLAESGDDLLKVGTYALVSGRHRVSLTLGPEAFTTFYPDRAFVVRSNRSPVDGFVLTGSNPFFSRLERRQVRFADDATAPLGFDPSEEATRAAAFARLVERGRRLFLNETFGGNGRTCGTCHVEANNFTVDPLLIATLPASDPLFVAETNPELATLENPELLRRFGLILVNADGFDPPAVGPAFVLRATQNVQALANSFMSPDASIDFTVNGRNPNP
ncbi:MAG: hypothetical protein ABW318_20295, partial [Vicinamibacterales bacterium]